MIWFVVSAVVVGIVLAFAFELYTRPELKEYFGPPKDCGEE